MAGAQASFQAHISATHLHPFLASRRASDSVRDALRLSETLRAAGGDAHVLEGGGALGEQQNLGVTSLTGESIKKYLQRGIILLEPKMGNDTCSFPYHSTSRLTWIFIR